MIKIGLTDYTPADKVIDIRNKRGEVKAKYSIGAKDVVKRLLMEEHYIEVSFELGTFASFVRSDYIEWGGRKYTLRANSLPDMLNKCRFRYTLKFEAVEMFFQDIQYYYLNQGLKEAEWRLVANPQYFLQIGIDNINRYFNTTTFRLGTIESTEIIDLTFSSETNVFDAFTEIAQATGCEWYMEDGIFHLLKKVYLGTEVDFETDVSVASMSRQDGEASTKYTRIVALGSTRNIPANYRTPSSGEAVDAIYSKRLRIPVSKGDVIDAYPDMSPEEAVEGTVIFDEVYPKRVGTVEEVGAIQYTDTNEDTGETTPWNAYKFKDSGLLFNKDYVLPGEELRLYFQSGNLNGRDFALIFHESGFSETDDSQYFEIVRSDDYGVELPNDTMKPQIGDEYVLYGFDIALVSDQYVPEAEQELYNTATEWLQEQIKDTSVYECPTIIQYFAERKMELEIGQKIRLISEDDSTMSSRIMGYEKKLNNPYDATYTVGDNPTYSRLGSIEKSIKELELAGIQYTSGGGNGVYIIRQFDATTPTDFNVFSAARTVRDFLSKNKNDEAKGIITFLSGLISSGIIKATLGAEFGAYIAGMIGGRGAALSVDQATGRSTLEIDRIHAREELVVPKITFNCIDVISGDKANTFAFGTFKSVDTQHRIAELDLLDDQLGTLKVNDICRGVFHNLTGGNHSEDSDDDNGFLNYAGFSTSYFTPTEILENAPGVFRFRYALQPDTTTHPSAGMNFYAYGNFTDADRQAMTYETRYYTRRLKNVDTWAIDPTRNISMQDGLLEGLTIGGMTMHGYGTFQENTYLTGVHIQFTPSQIEELQGKSAYNVSLSSYERVVKMDAAGNIPSLYEELNVTSGNKNVVSGDSNVVASVYSLSTYIQAWRGEQELLFAEAVDKDKYVVILNAVGCTATVSGGVLTVNEITSPESCYVDLKVNCEGNAVFEKRFSVAVVRDGEDGQGNVVADLDNEMQAVACDATGAVTSGLPVVTVFSMYYGTTKLSLGSLSTGSVTGVTATADKDTGAVTVTAIAADAADQLRIPVTGKATHEGTEYEITAYLSVTKVRPGADGKNAVIYSLQPLPNVIHKDSAGNYDVANIACRVLKTDGNSQVVVGSLPFDYSIDYLIDGNTPPRSYTPGDDVPTSSITKDIVFRLYRSYSDSVVMVDSEKIPVVSDGAKGQDGANGDPGAKGDPGRDGADGETPVVMQLIPSVTQIGRTMTGSYEPGSFTVWHKNTEGVLTAAFMAVWGSQDGNTYTRIGAVEKVSSKIVDVTQYPYKYFVIRTYAAATATWASEYLLSTSVNVLADGEKGADGPAGAMPVYCGFYDGGMEYTYTNTTRDIINYEIDGAVHIFQVKVHGSTVTVPPTSSLGDDNWEPANKMKFVAMDTALIDGANIAGFMYKNLVMISRLGMLDDVEMDIKDVPEGRMGDFRPNIQMDGNTGEAVFNKMLVRGGVAEPFETHNTITELAAGKSFHWLIQDPAVLNNVMIVSNLSSEGKTLRIFNASTSSITFRISWYSIPTSSGGVIGGLVTVILPSGAVFEAKAIKVHQLDSDMIRWLVTSRYSYNASTVTLTVKRFTE